MELTGDFFKSDIKKVIHHLSLQFVRLSVCLSPYVSETGTPIDTKFSRKVVPLNTIVWRE